jgi:hypothetical protein
MAADPKIIRTIVPLLDPEERVLGAFIGVSGPRPGVEALAVLPFVAVLIATSNQVLAWLVAIAAIVTVTVLRSYATVVRTDRAVLVIDSGRRRLPRAPAAVTRLAVNAIEVVNGSGDGRVTVGFAEYWVGGRSQDEARRLSRLSTVP